MAAAALPAPADAAPAKKGPSLVVQAGVLLATTLLAAGMGWMSGNFLSPPASSTAEAPAQGEPAAASHGEAKADAHGAAEGEGAPGHPTIIPLAPLSTNLAAPSDVWVRLEMSVEFKEAPSAGVADSIHQDLLTYMRGVRLHQMEGPSGIIHLKSDLDERARIRSGGKATRVLIRTLLFE